MFAIGLAEAYRITIGWANPKSTGFNKLEADYTPGDLGFDPLNLYPSGSIAPSVVDLLTSHSILGYA